MHILPGMFLVLILYKPIQMQFSPGDRRLQKRAGNIWIYLQRVIASTWYEQVIPHFMSAGSAVPEQYPDFWYSCN